MQYGVPIRKKGIIKYLWIKHKYGLQELLMIIRIWVEHKWCEETVEKDCAHRREHWISRKMILSHEKQLLTHSIPAEIACELNMILDQCPV